MEIFGQAKPCKGVDGRLRLPYEIYEFQRQVLNTELFDNS